MPVARSLASRRRGIQHDPIDAAPSASNEPRSCVPTTSCGRTAIGGDVHHFGPGCPQAPTAWRGRSIGARERSMGVASTGTHVLPPISSVANAGTEKPRGSASNGADMAGVCADPRAPATRPGPRARQGQRIAGGIGERCALDPVLLAPQGASRDSGVPCGPLTRGHGRGRGHGHGHGHGHGAEKKRLPWGGVFLFRL